MTLRRWASLIPVKSQKVRHSKEPDGKGIVSIHTNVNDGSDHIGMSGATDLVTGVLQFKF